MEGKNLKECDKYILTFTDPVPYKRLVWNVNLNVYFPISLRVFKRLWYKVEKGDFFSSCFWKISQK